MTVVMARYLFVALALSIASGADLKSRIDELVLKSPAIVVPTTGLLSVVQLEFVKTD